MAFDYEKQLIFMRRSGFLLPNWQLLINLAWDAQGALLSGHGLLRILQTVHLRLERQLMHGGVMAGGKELQPKLTDLEMIISKSISLVWCYDSVLSLSPHKTKCRGIDEYFDLGNPFSLTIQSQFCKLSHVDSVCCGYMPNHENSSILEFIYFIARSYIVMRIFLQFYIVYSV